jgi:hypothetical protein
VDGRTAVWRVEEVLPVGLDDVRFVDAALLDVRAGDAAVAVTASAVGLGRPWRGRARRRRCRGLRAVSAVGSGVLDFDRRRLGT